MTVLRFLKKSIVQLLQAVLYLKFHKINCFVEKCPVFV